MLCVHKPKCDWENSLPFANGNKESRSNTQRTRMKRLRSFSSNEKLKIVPVVVETHDPDQIRFPSQKVKLMVPFCMQAPQFTNAIRSKLQLPSYQSYSLLINGGRILSTISIGEVHSMHKNEHGLLCATLVPESTFGCPRPSVEPITPEFDSLDGVLPSDEAPENVVPGPHVIHLTATVSNPDMPFDSVLSPGQTPSNIPSGEGLGLIPQSHLQGIVNSIADAIVAAVSSPSVQNAILQSIPDSEITLSPHLVKDALLSYMHMHSITPPFNMDNFQTTIKITHDE